MKNKVGLDIDIKITPLRKEILNIVLSSKIPLSAYEILHKLRKKRPKAEPPTVYRVLDYLTSHQLIHRIDSSNKYMGCSQVENPTEHQGILFSCKKCLNSFEFTDAALLLYIKNFCKKNHLLMDSSLIEVKGACKKCS